MGREEPHGQDEERLYASSRRLCGRVWIVRAGPEVHCGQGPGPFVWRGDILSTRSMLTVLGWEDRRVRLRACVEVVLCELTAVHGGAGAVTGTAGRLRAQAPSTYPCIARVPRGPGTENLRDWSVLPVPDALPWGEGAPSHLTDE